MNGSKKTAARGEGDGTHGGQRQVDKQWADDDTTPCAPSLLPGAETPALPVREGRLSFSLSFFFVISFLVTSLLCKLIS